ncbi:MAG: LLM class flavin-dependent oxidoreductase [Gammaproteobacteria bacterium]|nr:LLM class flavin-dependent oxidoreductase [Gammaproteobacteria bacterium]
MALAKRMAVTLPVGPFLKDNIELVEWADANGYADAWFADSGAPDSLTMIAAIAPHIPRLRVGCAVTPVYTRAPSVLAATANVLGQVYGDRFIMGLGSSSETIMTRFNGIALEKPLTRVKETAIIVRSMLKGERTNFQLTTLSSQGYRQPPLENPPPLYLAALRPKMIEMAAEIGDGVIFNLWPNSALPKMMEHVKIGAERAGKDWRDVEVVNRKMILVTDDRQVGYARFRATFAPYYANPVYNNFLAWAGYEDVAREVSEGWAARDRERTTGAFSDELIDELATIGTVEEVQDRVRQDADRGIHTTIVAPLSMPGTFDAEEALVTFRAFTGDAFSF